MHGVRVHVHQSSCVCRRLSPLWLLFVCLTPACCQQIWRTANNHNYGSTDSITRRPNFVFILTDDQELVPNGVTHGMRYTVPMMQTYGATLQNFFTNTPVCCPSRATLHTGRYAHHWFVPRDDACMYMDVANQSFAQASMGVVMQGHGYTTGCFGKTVNLELGTPYCNKTTASALPGWNSSFALCNELSYIDNVWNVNGTIQNTMAYMTSVIGNESLRFVESSLQAGRPFFAYIGFHAPHLRSTPAPWYKDEFPHLTAPRTENFNFRGFTHHYLVRNQPPLSDKTVAAIDSLYRHRQRSLLSVDDIMVEVIKLLEHYDQLDTTYVIWTSDHGYQLGQFRLPMEKFQPYEHVIRVPFFIRGPGIVQNASLSFMASMVDVLPTIVELARGVEGGATADPSSSMDGHSFAGALVRGSSSFREKHLVEYWSVLSSDLLTDMGNHPSDSLENHPSLIDSRISPPLTACSIWRIIPLWVSGCSITPLCGVLR